MPDRCNLRAEIVEKELINVDLAAKELIKVELVEKELINSEFVTKEVLSSDFIKKEIINVNFNTIDRLPRRDTSLDTLITSATNNQILIYSNGYWINTDFETLINLFSVYDENPSGSINGVNTVFELANIPITGTVVLELNGLDQEPGSGKDYTISGKTITFSQPVRTGSTVVANYIKQN